MERLKKDKLYELSIWDEECDLVSATVGYVLSSTDTNATLIRDANEIREEDLKSIIDAFHNENSDFRNENVYLESVFSISRNHKGNYFTVNYELIEIEDLDKLENY